MKRFRVTIDRVSGVVLLGLVLVVLWESQSLPLGRLARPGPAFLPVLLASLLGGLSLAILARGGHSAAIGSLQWSEARHAAVVLATCVFAVVALELLGYRITMTVILACLLVAIERNRPVVAVSLAIGVPLASYWFFTRLGVRLPTGPLGF